jgi:DNA-binding NtrC family response regulator
MVIDDDGENVDILADTLRSEGYEVGEYTDPAEALEDFRVDGYEVVISDIKMPRISGLEVLEQVKKEKPETYVILVTGFASKENTIAAVTGGAYRFFRKPIDIRELIATLREIDNYSAEQHQSAV